jgi:hypothetical protein
MSPIFDLYGLRHESIEAARESVERALEVELVPHESSYLGDYFRGGDMDGEDLILQGNFDAREQDWVEPTHRDVPFLLYVNNPSASEATRARLEAEPKISRLRHSEV